MSWLASWFSGKTTTNRRSQALSATQEAFSLPSSVFSSHHDAYNPDTLGTPDPESAASPTYSYPPQSTSSQYGYVPTAVSSRSRPASLLPLHNTPLSPIPPYPPLEQTWNRLRTWLSNEYPELGDTLNYGILPQDLADIEMQFGFALPQAVRESYLCVDGQEPESSVGCSEGLFFGLNLLPLDEVLDEWRFWREVDNDPSTGAHAKLKDIMQSIPPNWIRREYSQRGWIPLITDKTGNYIGVDLNPAEGGSVGQVIIFGRDFDTKVVLWKGDGPAGWARWLANFVEELESGEGFELGGNNESEGSEDDVGYESYFFDGTGRGSGDGNGDSSAGGLKLTGEYRGWNVMEAWADRSVRKWHETGVITDDSLQQEKGKSPEKVGLGVLDLAKATNSAAEVPIPVFADISNTNEEPPLTGNNDAAIVETTRHSIPTISITKPPAPLPLVLPTQSDIIPSPNTPDSPSPSDIEEGRGSMMAEVDHPIPTPLSARGAPSPSHAKPEREVKEATLVPLPSSPVPAPSSIEPIPPPAAAPLADITDLLADTAPAMEAPTMQPTPSPKAPSFTQLATETPSDPAEPPKADDSSDEVVADEQVDSPTSVPSAGDEAATAEPLTAS
ncbi:hypothetical protein DENSPDRAFT_929283 [Dentipellis sp. KUC8613]|nr:hypothetical protein DENSPDRAFT_929283 [Dentipellis sp. KUC8613]